MIKNNYYIIGNGGFAKEVLILAQTILEENYIFNGFIDFKPTTTKINCLGKDFKIHNQVEFLEKTPPDKNVLLFMGIGNPVENKKIINLFQGYSFPNLVHPNFIGHLPSIKMGKGNIITAGCIFTGDISIGSFNVFNLNTTVGHDVKLGDFNVINPGVNISGSVTIGESNLIGTNATILQEVNIGNQSVLGAASLANKSIENNQIMVGVPAKPLKK